MKINRQGISVTNKITADWLYEFAYDLEKKAENVDYLKEYLNKLKNQKKFSSIDEKLADIRARVGLDLAAKISHQIENFQTASVKTASHSKNDVNLMQNILNYIEGMIEKEKNLDVATVLAKCREEEGLKFNEMEKKIDQVKLKKHIKELLTEENSQTDIKYSPIIPDDQYNYEDRVADYYQHAEPKS